MLADHAKLSQIYHYQRLSLIGDVFDAEIFMGFFKRNYQRDNHFAIEADEYMLNN